MLTEIFNDHESIYVKAIMNKNRTNKKWDKRTQISKEYQMYFAFIMHWNLIRFVEKQEHFRTLNRQDAMLICTLIYY